MKKVQLMIELEYDDEIAHGDDPEAMAWFYKEVLGADPASVDRLILWSSSIGEEVGTVKVIGGLT